MKPTYDEAIKVMTEAAMGAFHKADEAGCSPEQCWKASQEAAIRAMQDCMPDTPEIARGEYAPKDTKQLLALNGDYLKLWNYFKTMGRK